MADVWCFAGSDPLGGAGIQADLASIHDFGVSAGAIITAVTAQNSRGVLSINPVEPGVLADQVAALEAEGWPKVIKIGLLGSLAQVHWLARYLEQLKARLERLWVVLDPVAVATSGGHLTEPETLEAIKTRLLPQVDLITPNRHECQALTGMTLQDAGQCVSLGRALLALGPRQVLIKGGHLPSYPHWSRQDSGPESVAASALDCLYGPEGPLYLSGSRLENPSNHGTGCTLASALVAARALGYDLRDALVLAKAYVQEGLARPQPFRGNGVAHWGWPERREYYPGPVPAAPGGEPKVATGHPAFASCPHELGLYPVVPDSDWIARLLALGVKTLQLRIKEAEAETLEREVRRSIELGHAYGARVFINDHWQLALQQGAYGVHLGQEDLDGADTRRLARAGLRLGISCHGYYELVRALSFNPSYLAFGAVFDTATKDMSGQIQGLERLARYVRLCADIPTVAIGGINLDNARGVWQTGVGSLALVRAITESKDLDATLAGFDEILQTRDATYAD